MLQIFNYEDICKVHILKDVHLENSQFLEEALETFDIPNYVKTLQVSFANVKFIDSTGISFLVKWLYPLSEKVEIEILDVTEPVKKILFICKINQFVKIM